MLDNCIAIILKDRNRVELEYLTPDGHTNIKFFCLINVTVIVKGTEAM